MRLFSQRFQQRVQKCPHPAYRGDGHPLIQAVYRPDVRTDGDTIQLGDPGGEDAALGPSMDSGYRHRLAP